jgi:hypothetical protein
MLNQQWVLIGDITKVLSASFYPRLPNFPYQDMGLMMTRHILELPRHKILGLIIHALGMNGQQDAYYVSSAHFTLGVKANVQLKSSITIGAKVEISLKGFTLRVKAEIEKFFSIYPKLLIDAELLWPCIGPKA